MDVYGYQACVVKYGIEVDWFFFFFFSLLCNLSFRVGLSNNASVHLPLVIWDLTGLVGATVATPAPFQSQGLE